MSVAVMPKSRCHVVWRATYLLTRCPWQVDVVHRGRVKLKGVPQAITVMLLEPVMLSGRTFPHLLPGSKAALLSGSKGPQCTVRLPLAP